MTLRVPVRGALLAWAVERSRKAPEELSTRFPALQDWEQGVKHPTLKQLEQFATATHTPVGYFFLQEPPEEHLPVPDFRTIGNIEVGQASPDLLDTIYQCQQRQDWYRDYARIHREERVPFVGTVTIDVDITEAARQIREVLSFGPSQRGSSLAEAFRLLSEEADRNGVLVMVNGVVGSNTHRKLDPNEFRGFALVDEIAPVVFVNGSDTKAAQIFTLVHEIAHIWLGESGVSDASIDTPSTNAIERWCNEVAAELLVPMNEVEDVRVDLQRISSQLQEIARRFKVSTLVAVRQLFEAGLLSERQFRIAYAEERDRILAYMEEQSTGGGGGDFYNTQPVRVSKRFARAIIESTLEGKTLHRDAFQMLGFKKYETFNELARRLGLA